MVRRWSAPPKSDKPAEQSTALSPIGRLKAALVMPAVREQIDAVVAENRELFVASLLDLYSTNPELQQCDPVAVVAEALKAAALELPIARALGYAWIVPYKNVPQFQIGYRGYIQLALRTGHYRAINANVVYEGEFVGMDKLTGLIDLSGQRKSDKIVGYFAYLETVNGFRKATYWSKESVIEHAKRYSRAYNLQGSAWQTHPDAMCIKVVLSQLLKTYGLMSVKLQRAIEMDRDADAEWEYEVAKNANQEVIEVSPPLKGDPAIDVPKRIGEGKPPQPPTQTPERPAGRPTDLPF